MTIPRTLLAALAAAALLAPAAQARPIDGPVGDMHASTAQALAAERAEQEPTQDLRMPDRRAPAPAPESGPKAVVPTWPAFPQPLTPPAKAVVVDRSDDGIDWATIAIGVGLSVLAVALIAGISRKGRVRHRERVAV